MSDATDPRAYEWPRVRHDPVLCRTGRHGSWCNCTCGWDSGSYTSVSGAHLAFGAHLVDVATPTCPNEAAAETCRPGLCPFCHEEKDQ